MALGGKHTGWALPAMGGLVAGVLLVFLGFGAPGMEGGCGNFEAGGGGGGGGGNVGIQAGALSDAQEEELNVFKEASLAAYSELNAEEKVVFEEHFVSAIQGANESVGLYVYSPTTTGSPSDDTSDETEDADTSDMTDNVSTTSTTTTTSYKTCKGNYPNDGPAECQTWSNGAWHNGCWSRTSRGVARWNNCAYSSRGGTCACFGAAPFFDKSTGCKTITLPPTGSKEKINYNAAQRLTKAGGNWRSMKTNGICYRGKRK